MGPTFFEPLFHILETIELFSCVLNVGCGTPSTQILYPILKIAKLVIKAPYPPISRILIDKLTLSLHPQLAWGVMVMPDPYLSPGNTPENQDRCKDARAGVKPPVGQ